MHLQSSVLSKATQHEFCVWSSCSTPCGSVTGEVDNVKKQEYIAPKLTVVGTATDVTRGTWKAGGHHDKYQSGPGIFYANIS